MNWTVLKDFKTMCGFTIAILLGILSIVLTVTNNQYWMVPIILSSILSFFSMNRADKIQKK
ncbi:hypothetical protein [Bacillus sp. CDB3]|uniref:hypothetical protein n=1 Tax=Bacillus sp. CDB3 TaxID=360310 RepID=UPI0009D8B438|nr:hypothetical protein [Bacillus sp. CDB3]OQR53546.1 hypothetical protein CDB3_29130 [Bacillus sp. CDB3]